MNKAMQIGVINLLWYSSMRATQTNKNSVPSIHICNNFSDFKLCRISND